MISGYTKTILAMSDVDQRLHVLQDLIRLRPEEEETIRSLLAVSSKDSIRDFIYLSDECQLTFQKNFKSVPLRGKDLSHLLCLFFPRDFNCSLNCCSLAFEKDWIREMVVEISRIVTKNGFHEIEGRIQVNRRFFENLGINWRRSSSGSFLEKILQDHISQSYLLIGLILSFLIYGQNPHKVSQEVLRFASHLNTPLEFLSKISRGNISSSGEVLAPTFISFIKLNDKLERGDKIGIHLENGNLTILKNGRSWGDSINFTNLNHPFWGPFHKFKKTAEIDDFSLLGQALKKLHNIPEEGNILRSSPASPGEEFIRAVQDFQSENRFIRHQSEDSPAEEGKKEDEKVHPLFSSIQKGFELAVVNQTSNLAVGGVKEALSRMGIQDGPILDTLLHLLVPVSIGLSSNNEKILDLSSTSFSKDTFEKIFEGLQSSLTVGSELDTLSEEILQEETVKEEVEELV